MIEQPFIGVGRNPEGPDMPLGLGMNLMQNPKATDTFGQMSATQKERLIGYLQSSDTGEDAQNRMMGAIAELANGRKDF